MDERRGFLDAVRESPDDDLHRLAWSDWLDDAGQADRAAFVRAQVRHARLDDGPERDAAEDEADDLLAAHERAWLGGLDEVAFDWRWRRGFVETVALPAARLRDAEEALDRHPIRELRLVGNEATFTAAAGSDCLRRVESLDVGRHAPGRPGPSMPSYRDSAFRALLAAELPSLRALRLSGHEVSGPVVGRLIEGGIFARLRRLDLTDCRSVGDRATRQFADLAAPHLEELRLYGTNASDHGLRAALSAPRWPAMRRLHVSLHALFRRGLTDDALRDALLDAPLLPRLTVLDFSHRVLDRATLAALLRCPRLGPVEELRLHDCNLGVEEVALLADWSGLAHVRSLHLGNNDFSDAGVRALVASPFLGGLRHLDLSNDQVGGPGLTALANAAGLARLRTLNLASNYVGLPGVKVLAEGVLRPVALTLTGDSLGPAAGTILGGSPAFARLRELHLGRNRLDDQGVRALCEGPSSRRLRVLGLEHNDLDTPSLGPLLDPAALPALKVLSVGDNAFSDSERERLRRRFGPGLSG